MSGSDYPKRSLSTDSYKTDKWLLNMFDGWYDPCPYNTEWNPIEFADGLIVRWNQKTFVNPPYSDPKPWVKKSIMENKKYGCTVALLLKHDSSTQWYRMLHEAGARFLLIQGRLKHQTGTACAFPSVIALLEGKL
tara:strand:- start:545 stop:949 length:405 start_codon:yes stop_codon:yes gene_type:complete